MQRRLVLLQSKFNSIVTQFQDRWIEIEKHNYNYLYVRSPERCLSLFHPASRLSDAYAMSWHIPSLHRSVVSGWAFRFGNRFIFTTPNLPRGPILNLISVQDKCSLLPCRAGDQPSAYDFFRHWDQHFLLPPIPYSALLLQREKWE